MTHPFTDDQVRDLDNEFNNIWRYVSPNEFEVTDHTEEMRFLDGLRIMANRYQSKVSEVSLRVEQGLYKWVSRAHETEGLLIGAFLLQPPFYGVVVDFQDVKIEEWNLSYTWKVLDDGGCQEDLSENNIAFTKYLERIVLDRLQEIQSEDQNQQTDATEPSGDN